MASSAGESPASTAWPQEPEWGTLREEREILFDTRTGLIWSIKIVSSHLFMSNTMVFASKRTILKGLWYRRSRGFLWASTCTEAVENLERSGTEECEGEQWWQTKWGKGTVLGDGGEITAEGRRGECWKTREAGLAERASLRVVRSDNMTHGSWLTHSRPVRWAGSDVFKQWWKHSMRPFDCRWEAVQQCKEQPKEEAISLHKVDKLTSVITGNVQGDCVTGDPSKGEHTGTICCRDARQMKNVRPSCWMINYG